MTNHNQEALDVSLILPDALATEALGMALAQALPHKEGFCISLQGDLGAGKTSLVRAVLRALGHTGPVKSPTYALVEMYQFPNIRFYHFDFYRFNDPEEFIDAGLADYFNENAICCVEWPDNAQTLLPPVDLVVHFSVVAAMGEQEVDQSGSRRVFLQNNSPRGGACLRRLQLPASLCIAEH